MTQTHYVYLGFGASMQNRDARRAYKQTCVSTETTQRTRITNTNASVLLICRAPQRQGQQAYVHEALMALRNRRHYVSLCFVNDDHRNHCETVAIERNTL